MFVSHTGVHIPCLVCTKMLKDLQWADYGLDCIKEFLMYFRRPLYRGAKVIEHNSKKCDSCFIFNSMIELGLKHSLIMQVLGFRDHTKGYFPHGFSSEELLNYIGPNPLPRDYSVERMTQREQEEFYRW